VIYGSVCSGIEAATVAWHPLGWRPAFFSEIEPFPKRVLAHHYPGVPDLGDFTHIKDHTHDPIDLLVGGTPCQSFSVAGLRKGLDDPRGNLMLEFGALARRLSARWAVWENVPGVLSSNGGRDFGAFLGMLGELGYGYAYRVLDAQFFGVAQRRRRVFVVGHAGGLWQRCAAVLFEPESVRGDPAPRREAGQRPSGSLAARTRGGDGLGTDLELDGGLVTAAPGERERAR
jgi:DNA (cytosine-5)-methyltransferase 1